jgi:predicted porin
MKHKALTVAIAGALAAPMAAQAVDFTISGHINQALVFTDADMGSSTTTFKDNGSSGSRVRFTGSSETMSGITAGVNMEFGVAPDGTGAGMVKVRHAVVEFGGEFGSLKLGQTSEAADGTVYQDKSGVFGIAHGQETGDSVASSYTPGGSGARRAGLHFSSAAFGPAALHLSAANDERVSAKISFGGDAGIASYGGAIGYLDAGDDGDFDEVSGGLGIKLSSGVTISVAGASWSGSKDGSFVQSTLGYIFGDNAVGVSYYGSSDIGDDDGDGTAIGIGFKHTMPKAGVEIIAAVQQYSADFTDSAMDMDDTVAVIGSRIKF